MARRARRRARPMKFRQNLKPIEKPMDMVPMVTVFLLLIVFFLLCSNLILQPGIKVNVKLPSSGMTSLAPQSRLIITVALGGKDATEPMIFFNDERMLSLEALRGALAAVARKESGQTVVLKADARLSQGQLLEIINGALSVGFPVVIATQQD
ncbi:MAG: biopolymer transporter ExbD [Verrucomicrobiae bacterium]|nr:biopolymer transporter ExbD [Verrucomicrobiae bacterium]